MLSINTIQYLRSLEQKKFRQMYNNFVVEGDKMAMEILQNPSLEIEGIFALEKWIQENKELLTPHTSLLHPITEKELDRISNLTTPNKVFCVCKVQDWELDFPAINNSLTLYLDNIQNPGNFGSILRIADWFGIPWVFSSPDSVEVFNPKVIQGSMGSIFRVKTKAIAFDDLIEKMPTLPVMAAVLKGKNIFESDFPKKGILIIGNEGIGISKEIIKKSTHFLTIPKGKNSQAESLNAAVSTGIICAALINK